MWIPKSGLWKAEWAPRMHWTAKHNKKKMIVQRSHGTIGSFSFIGQQGGEPFVEYRSLFAHVSSSWQYDRDKWCSLHLLQTCTLCSYFQRFLLSHASGTWRKEKMFWSQHVGPATSRQAPSSILAEAPTRELPAGTGWRSGSTRTSLHIRFIMYTFVNCIKHNAIHIMHYVYIHQFT